MTFQNNEHAPKIMNDAPAMNHQHFTDMEYSGPVAGSKNGIIVFTKFRSLFKTTKFQSIYNFDTFDKLFLP
jgi:hypothetical protein